MIGAALTAGAEPPSLAEAKATLDAFLREDPSTLPHAELRAVLGV